MSDVHPSPFSFFFPLRNSLVSFPNHLIEFKPIKSIQSGVIEIPINYASRSETINPVNFDSSTSLYLGCKSGSTSPPSFFCDVQLNTTTTIMATRNFEDPTYPSFVSWQVVEFYPEYIKNKQYGEVFLLDGFTSELKYISPVNLDRTLLFRLGFNTPSTGNITDFLPLLFFFDVNCIKAERMGTSGSVLCSFSVMEFY